VTLVEMREARGWNQDQAAKRVGFARGTISLLERGTPQVIARRQYRRVAAAYGVTVAELREAIEKAQRSYKRRRRRRG